MADPMQVEVVSADRVVWSGKVTNIIAKTVDGDIGILPNHAPVLAMLVPGGWRSSARTIAGDRRGRRRLPLGRPGRVSILSEYATMANEVSLREAEKELAEAQARLDAGEDDDETRKSYSRASAQVRAAEKLA